MLHFKSLALRRAAKVLFRDANLQIHPGFRVGLTGANGTGKSSLFAMLLGEIESDEGECVMPEGWVTAHVAQEAVASEASALDWTLDGDKELREIEAAIAAAEAAEEHDKLAPLYARLEAADGYTARSRAGRMLHGLGFSDADTQRPVKEFSGGWRMRLNLSQALMCRSDLLLLDEPTNHLDLEAVIWLERWLRSYKGTLLLISHDREFLDSVCSHILQVEHQQLTLESGNYSAFEMIRAERLANQQSAYEKQQREIVHMQDFVRRFKAKASKAKQAQSRVKALERMDVIAAAHVDNQFAFKFRKPLATPSPLLTARKGELGYPGKTIVSDVKLSLQPGERIGLIGPNGAGKSTLIKALASGETRLSGEFTPAKHLRVAYFAQHQLEQLPLELSPLEYLQQIDEELGGRATTHELRSFVGGFGFNGDQALTPLAPMSGGEKARVVLAALVWQQPNLLLLDEPTNHLDIDMRLALAMALQEFEGALVVVSHDRHLLRTVCDELWLVAQGKVQTFEGDLEDYGRWLADQDGQHATANDGAQEKAAPAAPRDRKADRQAAAARREELKPLKNQLRKMENQLEKHRAELAKAKDLLAESSIYDDENKAKLTKLLEQQGATQNAVDELELEWLGLAEQIESLES